MSTPRIPLGRAAWIALVLQVALSTSACMSSRTRQGAPSPRPSGTGSRSVSSDMIAKWNVLDAFDVVLRAGGYSIADNNRGGVSVRQRRGQTSLTNGNADRPALQIDGALMSDYDMLRRIRASDIDRIDFLSPGDAAQRFGTMSSAAGAIIVVTRARR